MQKLLVICGPTATGKTKLALQLAQQFNGELVSADSRQVYRGMNIGTGKDVPLDAPRTTQTALTVMFRNQQFPIAPYLIDGIPLWMYDVVNPDEEFSVSQYAALTAGVISDIHKRGKLPILVGGTGFYIKAILDGIETMDIPRNEQLRQTLSAFSVEQLQQRLKIESPETYESMNNSDRNNPRRLIRKLEILSISLYPQKGAISPNPRYDALEIGLTENRVLLQQKIRTRVLARVEQGIVKEIQELLSLGYTFDLPAMNTMGYSEWQVYLDNPTDEHKQQAIDSWIHDEVSYAKKQMTWFKKQPNIQWFDPTIVGFQETLKNAVKLWYTK